ncbi:MAG: type I DNA topoisomerase [Candidatus Omnitrophica bacterium]|nr:type I DNA topoisomerase [Candidatus Omnitrophota bacterium]MDD5351828.1 type I DNA topoisomerase [Candidatus Omnitrophota bacterium]MDD5550654.1 type I DNA topoisomerase [Candidatus Omnitrophota bacterium]
MKKNLVIVESPAKAKTISKFLDPKFVVVSCMGHIIDLPQKELGIQIEDNFKADYVVIPKKQKLLTQLKKDAKDKEKIYFATDPDREGEAIGWNLKEKLKTKDKQSLRVVFHEITKGAIEEAFKTPRDFDVNKIQAQQARRILDRIVGYFLSPLLWRKVSRGLSAGRVQSVALRLIVEREREIQKFVADEFWKITAELNKKEAKTKQDKLNFFARLDKQNDKKIEIKNKKDADDITEKIKNNSFTVKDIQIQKKKKNPPAPFITSSLQQESFNKLGFSTTKTMVLAQGLYEGIELGEEGSVGLITYMRTDSTHIAQVAIEELRKFISGKYGKEYLPEKPNVYKSRALAQEAHEAIRPTSCFREPQSIKQYLSPEQYKLYELIWKRAVASQMNPALYEFTLVDIQAGEFLFKASGFDVLFKGYGTLYALEIDEEEEEKTSLPELTIGENLNLVNLTPSQHFTKPPARFSEGSLVKALEEDGVGRPSTYAPVIQTIISRDYVRRLKGYLFPTELGFKVSDLLVEYFPKIMNIEFTARMEEELDRVEDGSYNWINVLNEFYHPFKESIDFAKKTIKKEVVFSDQKCEKCGKQMVVKWGRRGKFLSCSDYPRCKFSKSITTGKICPEPNCGGELIERRSSKGKIFYGCSNFPKCRFTSSKLPE